MEDEIRKRMSEKIEKEMMRGFGLGDTSKYTTGKTITVEELNKSLKEVEDSLMPKWDNPKLDEFMEGKGSIEEVVLITPLDEMKDIKHLMTKHGKLKVQYSKFIPSDNFYLMVAPKYMDYSKTFTPTE